MSVVEVQSWWSIYFRSVTNSSSFYLLFSGSSYNQPFWISIAIKLGLKFISVPEGCVIIVLSYEVAGTKLILVIIMIAILSIVIIILTSMHSYRYTLIPMRARIYHFNPLTPRSNMYFSLFSTIQFLC